MPSSWRWLLLFGALKTAADLLMAYCDARLSARQAGDEAAR